MATSSGFALTAKEPCNYTTLVPKASSMLEKKLLMAISTYNLVRAIMCLAAQRRRIDPGQLSFSHSSLCRIALGIV